MLVCVLFMAVFILLEAQLIVATETEWPAEPQIFTPFTGKVCRSLIQGDLWEATESCIEAESLCQSGTSLACFFFLLRELPKERTDFC